MEKIEKLMNESINKLKKLVTMEKLKLKHLAPYLPYGLMLNQHREDLNINSQSELVSLSADKMTVLLQRFPYSEDVGYYEVKPILRPLSDLTKEIEIDGKKFIPIEKLKTLFVSNIYSFEDLRYKHHLMIKIKDGGDFFILHMANFRDVLCEWHFDVFGLIEDGLAIDIKTLDNA